MRSYVGVVDEAIGDRELFTVAARTPVSSTCTAARCSFPFVVGSFNALPPVLLMGASGDFAGAYHLPIVGTPIVPLNEG